MNGDEIWSIIGKVLALVGGVVGVIKIVEWFTSPKGKLAATVQIVPFVLPAIPKSALENIGEYKFMWIVVVSNRGSKPCTDVTLILPESSVTIIHRDGTEKELRKLKDGIIELGAIKPKEEIKLYAWNTWWSVDVDKIRLSHTSGIGKVLPRADAPIFFHDLETFLPMFKFIGLGCVLGLFVFYLFAGGAKILIDQRVKGEKQSVVTRAFSI